MRNGASLRELNRAALRVREDPYLLLCSVGFVAVNCDEGAEGAIEGVCLRASEVTSEP